MTTAFVIKATELKDIHNGLCELRQITNRMAGILSPEIVNQLKSAIMTVERGVVGVREQSDLLEIKGKQIIDRLQVEHGLMASDWAINEVTLNMSDVPYPQAKFIRYNDEVVQIKLNSTWLDLWVAANKLIIASGDEHHRFIEEIAPWVPTNQEFLILYTGS